MDRAKYLRVCKELDEKLQDEGKFFCSGCGQQNNLSHSHLVRGSKNPKLYYNPLNIRLHCLSVGKIGCHDKWESLDFFKIHGMDDFHENMLRLRHLDKNHYEFLLGRFERQGAVVAHIVDTLETMELK